jgi:hypothetical protein
MEASKVQNHDQSDHPDPPDEVRMLVRNQSRHTEEQSNTDYEFDGREKPFARHWTRMVRTAEERGRIHPGPGKQVTEL